VSLLVLSLLSGCGYGSRGVTQVDDVFIVAVVVDPPEVGLGDTVRVSVDVADPAGLGVQVLLWTCVYIDGRCAEDTLLYPHERMAILDPALDEFAEFTAPDTMEGLGQGESAEVPLWALACVPGQCGPLDEMAEVLAAEGAILLSPTQRANLADPTDWATELGFGEANLAYRTVEASTQPVDSRNRSPVAEARFTEALDTVFVASVNEQVDLGFLVSDANGDSVYAYGYTTIGEFAERRVKVENGTVHPWFVAPANPGTGDLWVVFDDRDGGVSTFHMPVEVQ
jgi:hypothetical protein